MCHTAEPHRAADTGAYRALPRLAALVDQPIADAGDPHFLARRRRGRDREQMTRQAVGLRGALVAARSTAGRHVDVSTVGSAKTASSTSAGWIDASSATVTPRRRIHPQVEKSDMYM